MASFATAPVPTAYCSWCDCHRTVEFWKNENDPGDAGWVRTCGHGDYVHTEDLTR